MSQSNKLARTVHDVALGAWFGGMLMGAVGLNAASKEIENPSDRVRVANAGWGRWTPLNLGAIGAYLASGAVLVRANKGRLAGQHGVARASIAKGILTGASLAATGYSRAIGQKIMNAGAVDVQDAVTPNEKTPPDVASWQRQLKALQWVIAAHVGALIGLSSQMGEQQRPMQVVRGIGKRIRSLAA